MSAVSFVSIFETSSSRVKGIAFHPRRSWVLISLHSGVIQIWDYRLRTLIDRFGEHDGPVRSVDFHSSQPLFVSGGDDYKVKVWNYKERRCLFTLSGHLDYIRTVQFHHEYPWILSASDDQTIRIWNWQSRQCISVLAGHGHYVMSAKFHPSEDLVVSASLDQTVRVWDISGLRKKNVTPMQYEDEASNIQNELFGSTDAVIKFVLEGHDRGVNWATFHPTLPYIISGSDDRQIKLWRMNGTKAFEMESMRGHYNNITNVLFHPREDVMISASEDRSLRVWDMTKRAPLYTYKKDHDRFWITSAHPKLNLFAAGHDSGLMVFKLQRERPPFTLFRPNLLLYIRDNTLLHSSNMLRMLDLETKEEVSLFTVRKTSSSGLVPRTILSHPQSGYVLVFFSGESGNRYEIFAIPKKGQSPDSIPQTGRGSPCVAVAWLKRDRFAVLSKGGTIMINDIESNEVTKVITPPHPIDDLFSAYTDTLLLRSEDKLTLYDVQQERVLNILKLPHVKCVVRAGVSKDSMMAIICRGAVVLTNGNLQSLCSVLETLKVKSGAWDENGTFIYSTLCHIKYILPNGDHGIVRTLDRPIYITTVKGNIVHCLDRQGKAHAPPVDTTEFMFKHALANKRFGQVSSMVKNSNLIGQAIIGYLQKKGYPEVALRFVKDEKTRFNLALECSTAHNIDIAFQSATVLNDKESWSKLGREALKQGNHQVVEKSYQQTLDFEKLSHLYFITGNTTKLRKMLQIATVKREDANAQFQNSLLLGDVPARVRVLEQVGQLALAYMTATNHGLDDMAESIRQKMLRAQPLDENGEPIPLNLPPRREGGKLLFPPTPVFRLDKGNWPVTRITRGPLDDVIEDKEIPGAKLKLVDEAEDYGEDGGAGWGDEDGGLESDSELGEAKKGKDKSGDELGGDEGEGWGDEEDALDGLVEDEPAPKKASAPGAPAALPHPGPSRADLWTRSSNLAAFRVAAGKFDEAMTLLNQQLGIVNFQPLKEHFLNLYKNTTVQLVVHPSLPSLPSYIEDYSKKAPRLPFTLVSLVNQFKTTASKAFTDGKFSEAKRHFLNIIQCIPLVVVDSAQEEAELRQLVNVCKEYLIGLTVELARKDIVTQGESGDQVRIAELAAYFTHCDLLTKHLQLTLKGTKPFFLCLTSSVAINTAAKVKNFQTVQEFANRLIDTNPPKAFIDHAEKALKVSQSKGGMNETEMNYDSRNPFVLCCQSLTPIYMGSQSVKCGYCTASYQPKYEGTTCVICNLSSVGKRVAGLQCVLRDNSKPASGSRGKEPSARDSDGW